MTRDVWIGLGALGVLLAALGYTYLYPAPEPEPLINEIPKSQTIVGYWECLPHKDTSGPQTLECAFGIALDQSDGHMAVDTSLMSTYPVDYAVGTKVRITGLVTPANQLSSIQKYDIDGIIRATVIEKI